MKQTLVLICFLILTLVGFGQKKTEKISENLSYTKLNKHTYIVVSHGYCNGLVYVDGKEAAIISTPTSDTATKELVQWINTKLKAQVVACIADHWHDDAMAGIDVLQAEGIKTFASKRTQDIAKQKSLPVPQIAFDDEITIAVGSKTIVARYFGPVHTADGSMVWLPNEKILFGGCGVKSLDGWVGNIGDADLMEWSTSIEKLKAAYPDIKIVVPGHGQHGDTGLLTYTINLFKPFKGSMGGSQRVGFTDFSNGWCKILRMEKDTVIDGKYFLKNAEVIISKDTDNIFVSSPLLEYDSLKQTVKAAEGSCYIEDKNARVFKGSFNFKELLIEPWQDKRGMTIMVERFTYLR